MKKLLIYALLIVHYSVIAQSVDSVIVYTDGSKMLSLNHNLFVLEDSSSSYSFKEILDNKKFKPSEFQVPNLGVSKSTFWIKFSICNKTKQDNLLLQLSYPLMDVADLYYPDSTGYSTIKAGDLRPFTARKYQNQNFIYDIKISQNEIKTFYIKIKGTEQVLVPLYLGTTETINEANTFTDILVGMYIGIILVMFIYNAFIFITVKDVNYLYYIIYILFIGLTQISLLGYSSRLLWPDNMWLSDHALYIVAALGSSAIAIFMKSFLNMNFYTPKLVYGVYVIVGIYIMAIIAALTNNQSISYNIIDVNGILIAFFCLFVAIRISMMGYLPARYFLIGWTVFLIGVFVFVFRSFGILPYNNFTNYTMPAGSALEVVLLSFALANKINVFKREKEESQAEALRVLRENEQIIKNQNVVLEAKVEERTKALTSTNNELTLTLNELKQTQSQLVNAEKMASLGQLTAGIAHEINNPINFVVSNVQPLKRDVDDIYQLVTKYEEITDVEDFEKKMININNFRKEIDYDYLKEEIANLLKGIEDGAIRTADIVKGLRVFSRLDENDLKRSNIIEGINSTLTLLNPEISGSMELIKQYSDIPAIECFPGKLNQVFMNILNNAIFAIKEYKDRKEKGKLIISTYSDETFVFISIKDNGIGMTDEVKAKIFEPFFTTKDVGKGTGLGMSITFSIIQEHNGIIELNTEYGRGTEFILKLPINYSKAGAA